jgi:hypothetical protein
MRAALRNSQRNVRSAPSRLLRQYSLSSARKVRNACIGAMIRKRKQPTRDNRAGNSANRERLFGQKKKRRFVGDALR